MTTPAEPEETLLETDTNGVADVETESAVAVCALEPAEDGEFAAAEDGVFEDAGADVCGVELPPPEPDARPVMLARSGALIAI